MTIGLVVDVLSLLANSITMQEFLICEDFT